MLSTTRADATLTQLGSPKPLPRRPNNSTGLHTKAARFIPKPTGFYCEPFEPPMRAFSTDYKLYTRLPAVLAVIQSTKSCTNLRLVAFQVVNNANSHAQTIRVLRVRQFHQFSDAPKTAKASYCNALTVTFYTNSISKQPE